MIKSLVSLSLVFLLVFAGCVNGKSKSEISKPLESKIEGAKIETSVQLDELGGDDMDQFIEDYYGLYCDMRLMTNEFWIQYYSPSYRSMIEKNGNDIPVMNMIGELMLNKMIIEDIDMRLENLKNNPLAGEFKESMRLIDLAYNFEDQYFKGSADLSSFEEFMSGVAQKQLAFAETIIKIQPMMIDEHAEVIDEYENLFSVESVFVYILEDSCSEAVWNEIAKQDGLQNDRSLATGESQEVQSEKKELSDVFISVPDVSTLTRSDNNAYYINGTTSSNCTKVIVKAQNITAGIYDEYLLKKYNYGNTSFKYGIREDWNNLAYGSNDYTFTAYCDDDQVVNDYLTMNFETYAPPQTNYTSYPSSYSSRSFKGYDCTDDCSGHEAGYDWAEDKGIYSHDNCGGNSNSFIEGCESYVDELMENRSVEIYEIDGDYAYGEDEYGNEVELNITSWDEGSYGLGEDEFGNELEFFYWD